MRFVNVSCNARSAMDEPVVRPVTAAETRPLRQRVLRPKERVEDLRWPHDDAPDTLHVGAFVGGVMIATATIHREAPPESCGAPPASIGWRLRGMATAPEMRGKGHGALLVRACVEHARARGGTIVWCNARVGAATFYERLGFVKHGDAFDLPEIGPHFVMSRRLDR